MKRVLIWIAVAGAFLAVFSLAGAQAVRALVRQELGQVFVRSRVSVGDCHIRSGPGISLSDIRIKLPGYYEVAVKEAALRYPRDLVLKGVNVSLAAPGKKIQEYPGLLRLAPQGPGMLRMIEAIGLRVEAKTLDCIIDGSLSLHFNALTQSGAIDFSVDRLSYDKLKATQVKGVIALSGRECVFRDVSARMLGGEVSADAKAVFEKELEYAARLKCAGLDIEQLVDDLKLRDKFTMTGKLSGSLEVKGSAGTLEALGGEFTTSEPGGTLVITDTKFLQNMASSTGQPADLLVESFKNYHYNNGMMTAGVKDGNVVLQAVLDGQAGKRNLEVVLHGLPVRRQVK